MADGQVIPISVDYARVGANGCVSMPAQGNIGWAIVSQQRWIAGQNLTEQAFARLTAGHLAGVVAPPTTTTVAPKAGSSGSSSTTWVLVAVIIVVVVAGVVLLIRRRRSSAPPSRGLAGASGALSRGSSFVALVEQMRKSLTRL